MKIQAAVISPNGTEQPEIIKTLERYDFVWDEAKHQHDFKIHRFSFETAVSVYNDAGRIDKTHSEDGDRCDTIGRPTGPPASDPDALRGVGPKLTPGRVHGLLFAVFADAQGRAPLQCPKSSVRQTIMKSKREAPV